MPRPPRKSKPIIAPLPPEPSTNGHTEVTTTGYPEMHPEPEQAVALAEPSQDNDPLPATGMRVSETEAPVSHPSAPLSVEQQEQPPVAGEHVDFDPASIEATPAPEVKPGRWANHVAKMSQSRQGGYVSDDIRVDFETKRKGGEPYSRVLISFSDDAKPTRQECQSLKDDGFSWNGASWECEKSPKAVALAYRIVNELYKSRGVDRSLYLGS